MGNLILFLIIVKTTAIWIPPQPKQNVWVTLANKTGQDSICIALTSPRNPFSTCLVGVPLDTWPCPASAFICRGTKPRHNVDNWDRIVPSFPRAALEPQELEILGSIQADACVNFKWSSVYRDKGKSQSLSVQVTPSLTPYRNASWWCNYTTTHISQSSNTPIQLPTGVFLICGDRAWAGIPSKLEGGPCTLGRLTLLTPNTSMILQLHRGHARIKRVTHAFTSDCNDNVQFWNPAQTFFGSIITGVGTAQALSTLRKLGCWLAKQSNATSRALSELLIDVDSVRHATLQNRAAIDFLLLAQGHGCEDFEGMCCMNLSDHSESIHAQIGKLRDLTEHLQVSSGFGLDDWLKGLGLGPWVTSLLQHIITIGIVLLALILIVPCFFKCIQNMIASAMSRTWQTNLLAQKENGGSVESIVQTWLVERRHS